MTVDSVFYACSAVRVRFSSVTMATMSLTLLVELFLNCVSDSLMQARKSMGYAKHLKSEAEAFMQKHLPEREDSDKAKGLPYLAVHLRRGDFARSYEGRPGVPSSMKSAAEQINSALKRTGLKVVYVATDASKKGNY